MNSVISGHIVIQHFFRQVHPSGAVTITNVANFGPAANINAVSPIETMNQFQNNLTWTKGDHTMKFGFGINHIYDFRRSNVNATYTFGSLAAYQAAIAPGATEIQRQSYTSYAETMGDPEFEYDTTFFSAFAQDDWKATRRLKLSYGLRYDLYSIPEGISDAPLAESRNFKVDKNNFSPRLGAVYLLREGDRPTVVRGSFGFYYDTVYLAMYEGALQENGVGRYANRTFTGRGNAGTGTPTAGAPSFPGTLGALPPGTVLPPQSITVVSPDFSNMYAMHFQTQIEQALSENYSITAGYIHSEGRQLAVYRQTNCMPTGAALADGRPKFSCAAGNRYNPTFQNIIEVGSGGNSHYDAMTLQLSKRFSQGYQFSFNTRFRVFVTMPRKETFRVSGQQARQILPTVSGIGHTVSPISVTRFRPVLSHGQSSMLRARPCAICSTTTNSGSRHLPEAVKRSR